jgi:hypothetical protein
MSARILTSPAYDGLLERLAEQQPNNGFQSADQLAPLLRPIDMATVLDHEPTVLAEACCGEALVTYVAQHLRDNECDLNRAAFIGAGLQGALAAKVRDYLLPEVQEECYRRAEAEREAAANRRRLTLVKTD